MRHHLHLVAAVLLTTSAASLHAQITNPDALVAGPPHRRDVPRRPANTTNPQWLWEYTKPLPNGRADQLRFDVRFAALLDDNFKQLQSVWESAPDKQVPLAEIIPRFVSRYSTVTAEKNRYITIDGCVPSFCAASGLVWFDLGLPKPLMVFAAVNWSTQAHTTDERNADFYLWLYPSRYIPSDALPFALTQSIAHWDARLAAAHRLVPHISHAILVEPDGTPVELQPAMTGSNTIAPQPDTITPKDPEN